MRVLIRRYKEDHYMWVTYAVFTRKATVDQALKTELRVALKETNLAEGEAVTAVHRWWGGEVCFVDKTGYSHRVIITEVNHD